MSLLTAPDPRLLGGLAALALAGTLVGCSSVAATVTEEVDAALADTELDEVGARFGAMTEIAGDPTGTTVVEAAGPGTVWALTRRDDVRRADPADCSLDGAPMQRAPEALNVPEPQRLRAEGRSQTLFAFAAAPVDGAGSATVSCDLGDAPALLLLFEPAG